MNAINELDILEVYHLRKVREKIVLDSHLFGLIKTERVIKTEQYGEELRILIDRVPEEVSINGVKYIKDKV